MKIISFFSQKGGCGKTTLAIITASSLAYIRKKKVLVIDGDFQGSFKKKHEREMKKIEEYKERMQSHGQRPYEVLQVMPKDIPATIKRVEGEYDYLVIDLPGNIYDQNVMKSLIYCNYVIVPLEHDPQALSSSIESTMAVTKKLHSRVMEGSRIEKVVGVFNRIPFSQTSSLSKLGALIKYAQFDVIMHNIIGRVDKMGDDRVCTLLPPENLTRSGFNMGGFLEELFSDRVLSVED